MRVLPGKTESEWPAKDHLETNPITIKPRTASHVAEQFSWVPWPYCSPPGCPFPIKSLALSVCESPQTIYRQESTLRPWKGPHFLKQYSICLSPSDLFHLVLLQRRTNSDSMLEPFLWLAFHRCCYYNYIMACLKGPCPSMVTIKVPLFSS